MRVEPIRSKEKIAEIAEKLKADETDPGKRRYLMWLTGIYLGRRISDMLPLKITDVLGKDKINVREKKTGKQIELFIAEPLQKTYTEILGGRRLDGYVFQSRYKTRSDHQLKPIDRQTAYRDMQKIKKVAGIPEDVNVGTHTMRKTFGYHYYQATHDVATLMKLFNHSKEETTLIYIGIEQDNIKDSFRIIDGMYNT